MAVDGGRRTSCCPSVARGAKPLARLMAALLGTDAGGHPIDLGDLAAGLDRRALTLVLAAIAHAAGSHEHQHTPVTPTASRTRVTDCRRWFPGPSRTSREPSRSTAAVSHRAALETPRRPPVRCHGELTRWPERLPGKPCGRKGANRVPQKRGPGADVCPGPASA